MCVDDQLFILEHDNIRVPTFDTIIANFGIMHLKDFVLHDGELGFRAEGPLSFEP